MSDDSNHKVTVLTKLTTPAASDVLYIADVSESLDKDKSKGLEVSDLLTDNNAKLNGAIGDGVADDTTSINSSLAALKQGEELFFPPGTYKITSELTEPTVSYWGILGAGTDRGTIFDISGVGSGNNLIPMTKRGASCRHFRIIGDVAAAPNYTVHGLALGDGTATSNLTLEHLHISKCAKALVLNNVDDSKSYDALELFSNTVDISVEGNAGSSQRFTNTSMLDSEQCLNVSVTSTNFAFDLCTFAAAPFNSATKPVNLAAYIQAWSITKSRFEPKDTNNSGKFWDALYTKGASSAFPVENLSVEDNYFTGKIENAIHLDNFIRAAKVNNNHFVSEPNNADIKTTGQTVSECTRSGNRQVTSRSTQNVIYDFTLANPFTELTITFTAADATPTVGAAKTFITAGTTAITDFDDGGLGDTIKILAASSITITDGSPIQLSGSVNFDMVSGDTLTLHMFNNQVWEETARSTTTATSEVVTTTNLITVAESGKIFYLNAVGGFTSTLPAPAIGLNYKFIVSTAPTTAYIITTNSSANILFGTFLDIVGELVYFSAQDTLNFVASTSLVGDFLEVESDGTNWYCVAKSGADGGITVSV